MMKFDAIFFDLDNTLVDSKLDFDKMRQDLDYPTGVPILEHLATISSNEEKAKHLDIIHKHEKDGAENSSLFPGVIELLDHIQREKLPTAIITRNSQETAQHILNKHSLNFDIVISREDTPPKPDPTQLNNLVSRFNLDPKQCLYIGDMSFDLDFARNAGVKSGLYVRPNNHSIKNKADIVISCYDQFLIGQRAL